MKEIPPHIKEKIDKLTEELKKVYELAEESWEGCDGCDENDKHFFIKGFQAGYNRAKPDELSNELRYKDGTPMKKYNSPKLQAIEMEISDEEIEKAAENYGWRIKTNTFSDPVKANELAQSAKQDFMEGAKWHREQLKQKK